MTDDALLVLDCLFDTIWAFFTSWHIPGTDVTPAGFFFFLAAASIGLTFVCRFLGIGGSVSATGVVNAAIDAKVYSGLLNGSSGSGQRALGTGSNRQLNPGRPWRN